MKRLSLRLSSLATALLLAGCASVSPDGLRSDVAKQLEGRLPAQAQLPAADAQSQQSAQTKIDAWLQQPLDAEGWPLGPRALLVDFAALGLNPDGAVTDSEGAICVACWGAGKVLRISPEGQPLGEYTVGGRHSSCPAFGGADMRDLLVTTACEGITDPDPAQGLPYLIRADIPGLPEPQVIL